MCSLPLVTAVAGTLHPLRSLSSTSWSTVFSSELLWLLTWLSTTGAVFHLRRLVEGLAAASRHLTGRLSAALGVSECSHTYSASLSGVDTLWRRHAVRPLRFLLVAVRWWLVLLGDLLAVAGLVGAAARALDLLLGRFGLPLLGNLSSAVTGLGCGAIALDLGPLLAYQASGWMLLLAPDLFLVLWQVLPLLVLQVRHLRLMRTRRRWLSRILHATKAEASVGTGCLSVTFSVTAVATYLLFRSGDVLSRDRRFDVANCASCRPYDAHARSENARWTGCAEGAAVGPRCRRNVCLHRVELLLVIADCIPRLLRATVSSCDLAGFLDCAPPLALVDGIFHRLSYFCGS